MQSGLAFLHLSDRVVSSLLVQDILFRRSATTFSVHSILFSHRRKTVFPRLSEKMKLSLTTIIVGLAALASASIVDTEGIRNAPREVVAIDRRAGANGNRPVASGNCCIAETSLKQDVCNAANGAQGRCVPGGSGANCEFFLP